MFTTVLIANRGEIAVRICKTLRAMGIRSVAVYSEADRYSPHVQMADSAEWIGPAEASDSYLRSDTIIAAARKHGAQAIIPGYGFLSENADFAEDCRKAGICFVGPTPEQMREFGLKHSARHCAAQAGVPLVPGTGLLDTLDQAIAGARKLGYPLMLKSTAGGGGIGLMHIAGEAELVAAYESVKRQGESFFSNGGVFLERYLPEARHIEVQIFGDGAGRIVVLGERDCSAQRRNQKVIEETPAPGLQDQIRTAMHTAARKLGESVQYLSAGTVEFIYQQDTGEFYFLEVNTRLQVEHPITEEVFGIDLVEWMIRTAAGDNAHLAREYAPSGWAIEARVYAEDPARNFLPVPGTLTAVAFPPDVRVDTWVSTGSEVSPHYDPMLAKIIVTGHDREDAIRRMQAALEQTTLYGGADNLDYLRTIVAREPFASGNMTTTYLNQFAFAGRGIEVQYPGTYSTVQDYPGRVGYWHIGVPPSGPMDDYAFRVGNSLVGNLPEAAGLECTFIGPRLRFHDPALIALTGAPVEAYLDGEPVETWRGISVSAGQELAIGRTQSGCRCYLAVSGGIAVPEYLGSKATFVLGQFGGHLGRTLKAGDTLRIGAAAAIDSAIPPRQLPQSLIPDYPSHWEIGVLYGPHGAPDFFTPESIEMFFSTDWEIHYNSNRLGIRLNGPKPSWTRSDGGEAGLHPSNIHDCEYAVGSINFTGDMPIILTHDGPSLGGFVCPATIVKAELWKVGQVKPGDTIRFRLLDFDTANRMELDMDRSIENLSGSLPVIAASGNSTTAEPVLASLPQTESRPEVKYRQAGDHYILIEYGPNILDLRFRLRVHGLMQELEQNPVDGICELSPGVRSLQVRYDGRIIHQHDLLGALQAAEQRIPPVETMEIATRVLHLPLAFEDSATLEAVDRYRQSVRQSAPWLPNNVDFIQRINGLPDRSDVRDIIFNASYMVLGLGDVYLGAPCAVPVDPRHRLLTSKYNPARTYTAEGTVGIGGVYMCIYGMDSPGGYQLVGRTIPIWNKYLRNPIFTPGEPWLLRFFDQVRYYPVSEQELAELRQDFREGHLDIEITEERFSIAEHERFLEREADDIAAFQKRQQQAFTEEVARWSLEDTSPENHGTDSPGSPELAVDGLLVESEMHASIWKILVEIGHEVKQDDPLVILEAMKMEIPVLSPVSGVVTAVHCEPGKQVAGGTPLIVVKEDGVL